MLVSNDPRFNDFECNENGCVDGCDCPDCMPPGCMDETPPAVAAPAAPVASWFLRREAQFAAARKF